MPRNDAGHRFWIYSLAFAASALVAWLQYPALCPSNSSLCFHSVVSNGAMFIGCFGLLLLYLWKFLSQRSSQESLAPSASTAGIVPRVRVAGFTVLLAAVGWLIGGGFAGFT